MGVNGIYGLSGSGLDIESLVKVGMLTKQNDYDKMYKKEISAQWEKEAYNDVYNDLTTYKYSTLSDYKMQSVMNAMEATSSDTSTVSAVANGAAVSMSHTVKVNALASNAYLLSTDPIERASAEKENSIYLKDLLFADLKVDDDGNYVATHKVTDYGKDSFTFTAEGSADTIQCKDISYDSATGKYTLTKADDSGTIELTEDELKKGSFGLQGRANPVLGEDISLKKEDDGTITAFSVAEKTIHAGSDVAIEMEIGDGEGIKLLSYTYEDLANNKSLYDLATDMAQDLNIKGSYDSNNDTFSIFNNDGGEKNEVSLKAENDNAAKLLNALNLGSTDGKVLSSAKTFSVGVTDTTKGVNGSITIDGKTYDNLTSNKTTIAGVTYTLSKVSAPDEYTNVTVTQDTEAIVDKVKQFVEDYNKILDSLNEKYNETKYSDYEPLTKSQEAAMSETQIEKWNEKAKSGLLYHSSTIRDIISDMREAIYTPIDGIDSNYNTAMSLGISSSTSKGHLTLDEDKLREALAADPDCVYQIFSGYEDEVELDAEGNEVKTGNNVFGSTGLAWRLNDVMTEGLSSISSYAGTESTSDDDSYLGKYITNLETKMASFKTQMDAYEDLLFKRYDAMERAIQQMSVQLSVVMGSNG